MVSFKDIAIASGVLFVVGCFVAIYFLFKSGGRSVSENDRDSSSSDNGIHENIGLDEHLYVDQPANGFNQPANGFNQPITFDQLDNDTNQTVDDNKAEMPGGGSRYGNTKLLKKRLRKLFRV
jgi:hypothetical protein